jgi:lambda repressor-like predicted transcriptional regulator
MQPVAKVQRAARKAALARQGLEQAIREAHDDGASLRALAAAAGVSHEQIRRILNR